MRPEQANVILVGVEPLCWTRIKCGKTLVGRSHPTGDRVNLGFRNNQFIIPVYPVQLYLGYSRVSGKIELGGGSGNGGER